MKACPIPLDRYPVITMAHGGGGRLMHDLIEQLFFHAFDNPLLAKQHDGAVFSTHETRYAFTTDSYVVSPLFFPGGDIGKLAVYGTVNDLAMCGARPLYLSLSLILEEGLSMETLWTVVNSVAEAALEAKVQIITGDTKVVGRGSGDKIFINTSGIGEVRKDVEIGPWRIKGGDVVILSGDIGRHGISVLEAREELGFKAEVKSDSAPVSVCIESLLDAGVDIHCLRDLTRGGLASALNEISHSAKLAVKVDEKEIPVESAVRGSSEMLGLDPLYIANEGRFIAIVRSSDKDRTMSVLKEHNVSTNAHVIGEVLDEKRELVVMKSLLGTERVLDMLSGEQFPRIC